MRLVAHAVARVSDDGYHNLIFGRFSIYLQLLGRVHSDLETGRKCGELASLSDISVLQSGPHRVYIEEWVFPMLNVGHGSAVHGLVTRVSNSGQVHVRTLFSRFNSLELSIVEICSIIQVLLLGGTVVIGFETTEIIDVELLHVRCMEALDRWGRNSLAVL